MIHDQILISLFQMQNKTTQSSVGTATFLRMKSWKIPQTEFLEDSQTYCRRIPLKPSVAVGAECILLDGTVGRFSEKELLLGTHAGGSECWRISWNGLFDVSPKKLLKDNLQGIGDVKKTAREI